MDKQVIEDYLWARWDVVFSPVPAHLPTIWISETVFIGVKWPYLKLTFYLGLVPKLRLHVILSHIRFYDLVDQTVLSQHYSLLHFSVCENHVMQIQKYLDAVFLVAGQKLKSHLQSMGRNTQVCGPCECTDWGMWALWMYWLEVEWCGVLLQNMTAICHVT